MTVAGFTLSRIAVGLIAAGIQSAIGNVVARSSFAAIKSFGALGGFVGMTLAGSFFPSSICGRKRSLLIRKELVH